MSTNELRPINFDIKHRPRRQNWNGELIETGMFYFARRRLIERYGLLQNEKYVIYYNIFTDNSHFFLYLRIFQMQIH